MIGPSLNRSFEDVCFLWKPSQQFDFILKAGNVFLSAIRPTGYNVPFIPYFQWFRVEFDLSGRISHKVPICA